MDEREFSIINPAAKMKNLCPVKQTCGKLLLQRSEDIVLVFRLVRVGQPYGNKD